MPERAEAFMRLQSTDGESITPVERWGTLFLVGDAAMIDQCQVVDADSHPDAEVVTVSQLPAAVEDGRILDIRD